MRACVCVSLYLCSAFAAEICSKHPSPPNRQPAQSTPVHPCLLLENHRPHGASGELPMLMHRKHMHGCGVHTMSYIQYLSKVKVSKGVCCFWNNNTSAFISRLYFTALLLLTTLYTDGLFNLQQCNILYLFGPSLSRTTHLSSPV